MVAAVADTHVTRIPIVAMVPIARGVLGALVECARRRLASNVAPIVKVSFGDPQRDAVLHELVMHDVLDVQQTVS